MAGAVCALPNAGGTAVTRRELVGRWQEASSDVAWPVLAVLFLASAAGFLYGFFGYAFSGFSSRPPPQVRWEALVHLGLGVAALLVFPLALWLRTRARAALVLLLVMATLSGAGLALVTWEAATCAPYSCDPDKRYYPYTPLFRWISGLRD